MVLSKSSEDGPHHFEKCPHVPTVRYAYAPNPKVTNMLNLSILEYDWSE